MQKRLLYTMAVALTLIACDKGLNYTSSVPSAPVQIRVNTKEAFFVHFIADNIGSYLVVNEHGFILNGRDTLGGRIENYYGYAGVVAYVDNNRSYSAFDLCCPHCLDKRHPTRINGIFAECPICGEQYDLSWGLGVPTQGISREGLRRYSAFFSGDILTIRN